MHSENFDDIIVPDNWSDHWGHQPIDAKDEGFTRQDAPETESEEKTTRLQFLKNLGGLFAAGAGGTTWVERGQRIENYDQKVVGKIEHHLSELFYGHTAWLDIYVGDHSLAVPSHSHMLTIGELSAAALRGLAAPATGQELTGIDYATEASIQKDEESFELRDVLVSGDNGSPMGAFFEYVFGNSPRCKKFIANALAYVQVGAPIGAALEQPLIEQKASVVSRRTFLKVSALAAFYLLLPPEKMAGMLSMLPRNDVMKLMEGSGLSEAQVALFEALGDSREVHLHLREWLMVMNAHQSAMIDPAFYDGVQFGLGGTHNEGIRDSLEMSPSKLADKLRIHLVNRLTNFGELVNQFPEILDDALFQEVIREYMWACFPPTVRVSQKSGYNLSEIRSTLRIDQDKTSPFEVLCQALEEVFADNPEFENNKYKGFLMTQLVVWRNVLLAEDVALASGGSAGCLYPQAEDITAQRSYVFDTFSLHLEIGFNGNAVVDFKG